MRYKKFIIFDGEPIFGYVEYHMHLLPKNVQLNDPRLSGGGLVDIRDNIVLFHGESSDFGRFDSKMLQEYFETKDYTKNFSLWYLIRKITKYSSSVFKFQEMDELHNIIEYKTTKPIDLE